MRRFHSTDIDVSSGLITLNADEAHHARDVLRLKIGDEVSVFDGAGREFAARIYELKKQGATLAILRETEPAAPESPLHLTLASVVIPGDKYDLIVQKAVELGVMRLIPLSSIRCEVKLKDIARKTTRWRRIALDAAKQCGRAALIEIAEPMSVTDLISRSDETESVRVFFSERDGAKLAVAPAAEIRAVIGPKGGWDDAELAAAKDAGFNIVTLGGRIMRAETAAISLTAILQNKFGDIN